MKYILLYICLLAALPIQVFASEDMNSSQLTTTESITTSKVSTSKTPSVRERIKSDAWVIESFNGKDTSVAATIRFDGKNYQAKMCNSQSGTYRIIGNTLVFRAGISTLMYCEWEIMDIENAMAVSRAKIKVTSNTLTITTKKGDVITWKKK